MKLGQNQLIGSYGVAIKLTEANKLAMIRGDWIEATHTFKSNGTYKGDDFGLNDLMILDFDKNFKAGVVRRWKDETGKCRVPLNAEHFSWVFMGWITDTKVEDKQLSTGERVKSLWIKTLVTPDAVKANRVGGKEYISIEYCTSDPMYVDDQTGVATANVLTGGALTSSPFVMELTPFKLSALFEYQKDQEDNEKKKEQLNKSQKEEGTQMKTIIATLGTAGIKLSTEASPDAVCQAIQTLSTDKAKAEGELSTVKAEVITLKSTLSKAEKELSDLQESRKKELSAIRERKISELKERAVKEVKLSKGEVDETDKSKQVLFVKLLSLEDLSLAEQELDGLSVKTESVGVEGNAPETLSTEEAQIKAARDMVAESAKSGKALSNAEALAKIKAIAYKGGK